MSSACVFTEVDTTRGIQHKLKTEAGTLILFAFLQFRRCVSVAEPQFTHNDLFSRRSFLLQVLLCSYVPTLFRTFAIGRTLQAI